MNEKQDPVVEPHLLKLIEIFDQAKAEGPGSSELQSLAFAVCHRTPKERIFSGSLDDTDMVDFFTGGHADNHLNQ